MRSLAKNYKFMNISAMNKSASILESVIRTANAINEASKELPQTGKIGRNIFIKSYNRRPRNKQKRAAGMAKIIISAAIGVAQIHLIQSAPVPKDPNKTFQSGIIYG